MLIERLFRHDVPGYNAALRLAFQEDPTLAADEPRAIALAAEIYARLSDAATMPDPERLNPALLQSVVSNLDAMPWFYREETSSKQGWWRVNAILDTAGLSVRERTVLSATFDHLEYLDDPDVGRGCFSAVSVRADRTPSPRYQRAALQLARDAAERLLARTLASEGVKLLPSRSHWRSFADRLILALG